jgi:hypothetical protein
MASYRNELLAYALTTLGAASALGYGCASIIGADEYKVAGGGPTSGPTGSGGSDTTSTTSTSSTTTGGTTCSGANPAGGAMCGPNMTCNSDECGPPVTYTCFAAGTKLEGQPCDDKTDCAANMMCLHYNQLDVCRKQCLANTDCPAGYVCTESWVCGDNPDSAGKYCAKPCSDVVTAAGSAVCGGGFRCNFGCDKVTHASLPPTCDYEAGTATSGPCTADGDCAAGYFCLVTGTDGGAACTQACRSNGDCATGTCTGTIYCDTVATTYHYCKAMGAL